MMRAAVATSVVAGIGVLAWARTQQRIKQLHDDYNLTAQKLTEAEAEAERKEQQRQDERRGRVSAEKELRRVLDAKLDTTNGLYVQRIGTVESCFRTCLGTPRQGLFAPSTRGTIVFHRSISPESLQGLEVFSHVWIVFEFNMNTNGKNTRAHEGLRADSHRFTFKAKITPPRLKEKVGVFSTRSPHRPNPIGVTLAKIERIEGRHLHISGLDLIDGTPVYDIKPYVPAYDALPSATVASWVSDDLSPTSCKVDWSSEALMSRLELLSTTSRFYRGQAQALQGAIEQVLLTDVRTSYQTKRLQSSEHSELVLDNVRVQYRSTVEGVLIFGVEEA